MKASKLLLLGLFFMALTALMAGTPRVYQQKCILDNGEMPPVNNPALTPNPDYIVRATLVETGETLGTDLGNPITTIRIFRFGNGTTVPYYTVTYVQLGSFPTQWVAGMTIRMFVQYIPTGGNTSWDLVIPAGTALINIQTPQIIPPFSFGPATNPNPADGSNLDIATGSTLNLSWSNVGAADGYKLFWNDATEHIDLTETNWTTPVLSTGAYSWKVVPYQDSLDVPDCPTWHFNVTCHETNPATNPSPADNTVFPWTADTPVTLGWSAPAAGDTPSGYKLVFNNTAPIDLGSSLSWTTASLPRGTYTWQIIPYYNTLEATNCPVWSFSLVAPAAQLSANGAFGDVWVNHTVSRTFGISNTGNAPLDVNLLLSAGAFALNPPAGSYQILPQESLELSVSFLPTSLISYSRNLYVETNDPNLPFEIVPLSGQGYNLVSAFTADPYSGLVPLTVHFSAQLQSAHANWRWNFGDGSTGEGNEIDHTFTSIGEYGVSLEVEDNWGFTQVSSQTIQVISWADISISDDELLYPNTYLGDTFSRDITITNMGPGNLNLQSIALKNQNPAFSLAIGSAIGMLLPGANVTIQANFSPLAEGMESDSLIIVSDALNSPRKAVFLQGRGLYVPPEAPTNVNITIDNVDALITWDAVTQSIYGSPLSIPYYFVYGAKTPDAPSSEQFYLGYSTGTSFRHLGVALPGSNIQPPGEYFYTVSAVIWYPPRGEARILDKYIGKATREEMQAILP